VRITQASRDRGVDAIVFDPDPLRGGTTVIQAKRYVNTVDLSAVRELFGTVQAEGANKGILVTTSDFGPDARAFCRGKPLELFNGAHEPTENVFHARAQRHHRLYISRRTRAKGAGDFDGGAGLAALAECDGVGPTLISASLARGAPCEVERRRRRGFARLSAQLRVCETCASRQESAEAAVHGPLPSTAPAQPIPIEPNE
jgi:hypothetical protein